MNIWIFNPYDPLPGEGLGELRYARLAKALVAQGHQITCPPSQSSGVTCPPSQSSGVTCPPSQSSGVTWWTADWSHTLKKRRLLQSESEKCRGGGDRESTTGQPGIGKLEQVLIPVPAYHKNISLRRVWSHWRYARGIAARAEAYVAEHGKPDVILFSVPPMEAGAVALKLGRKYGAKVVLDVMDAWPQALARLPAAAMTDGGSRMAKVSLPGAGRKFHPSFIIHQSSLILSSCILYPYSRMMRRYCREADAVCAQSQAFADYARSFGAEGEIPVFYLGAARRDAGYGIRIGHSKMLRILYLGSMGRVYDLRTLVDAVLKLLDAGMALRLDLVGEGEQRAGLEARVAAAGRQEAIVFHGYLQGEALAAVMAEADVGVVPMHPSSAVSIPYKACDYLAAGLPVINSLPGELQEKLDAYGCGPFYKAGDAASLAGAVRPWLEDAEALAVAKAAACRLFDANFDAERIYPKMAEWLLITDD